MVINDFLSGLTDQYRNRYLQRANSLGLQRPDYSSTTTPVSPTPQTSQTPTSAPAAIYKPSTTTAAQPDATYSIERQATLDYSMRLEFNLAAIARTAQSLSGGNLQSVDEFAAAGFGLNADLHFQGQQTVETTGAAAGDTKSKSKQKLSYSARQASQFSYQSTNFALQSAYNESTDVARSLKVSERDGYRRSVNKFALRYSLDNSFSFSFVNRFNVQTRQVSEQVPESLSDYVSTAGNLAEKGSSEMMATFFDAVDQYLAQAEETLTANATASFDMAAEELGFSGQLVDTARDKFVSTIGSFFDRVDAAIDGLESMFAPSTAAAIPSADYFTPAVGSGNDRLAVA